MTGRRHEARGGPWRMLRAAALAVGLALGLALGAAPAGADLVRPAAPDAAGTARRLSVVAHDVVLAPVAVSRPAWRGAPARLRAPVGVLVVAVAAPVLAWRRSPRRLGRGARPATVRGGPRSPRAPPRHSIAC